MIEKILENLCFQGFFAVNPVTTNAKGRKVKKKDITLSNAFGGTSVHNETTQNTLLYGIQNIF